MTKMCGKAILVFMLLASMYLGAQAQGIYMPGRCMCLHACVHKLYTYREIFWSCEMSTVICMYVCITLYCHDN